MQLYVVKRKQRVEGKRKERDEKREEGFSHWWSFFGCVKSLVCSMLHPVVERSLWSAVWGHNWCVVRTQLSAHCLTITSAFRHKSPQSSRSLLFSQSSKSFLPRSRLKSLEVEVPLRGSDKIHRCDDKRTRWERTLTTEQLTSSSKERTLTREQLTSSSKENKEGQVLWKIQPTNYMQTKNVVSREAEGFEN